MKRLSVLALLSVVLVFENYWWFCSAQSTNATSNANGNITKSAPVYGLQPPQTEREEVAYDRDYYVPIPATTTASTPPPAPIPYPVYGDKTNEQKKYKASKSKELNGLDKLIDLLKKAGYTLKKDKPSVPSVPMEPITYITDNAQANLKKNLDVYDLGDNSHGRYSQQYRYGYRKNNRENGGRARSYAEYRQGERRNGDRSSGRYSVPAPARSRDDFDPRDMPRASRYSIDSEPSRAKYNSKYYRHRDDDGEAYAARYPSATTTTTQAPGKFEPEPSMRRSKKITDKSDMPNQSSDNMVSSVNLAAKSDDSVVDSILDLNESDASSSNVEANNEQPNVSELDYAKKQRTKATSAANNYHQEFYQQNYAQQQTGRYEPNKRLFYFDDNLGVRF